MSESIFSSHFEVNYIDSKELNLEKAFLDVLRNYRKENLTNELLIEHGIIKRSPSKNNEIKIDSEVDLKIGNKKYGRVDARVKYGNYQIFYEFKFGENKFTKSQLKKYIEYLTNDGGKHNYLILIGPTPPSQKILDSLDDSIKILPLRWDDLYDFFEENLEQIKSKQKLMALDIFLLENYNKYLLETGAISSRFTKEEANILLNWDKKLPGERKIITSSISQLFKNLTHELIRNGFDENGFRKGINRSHYENPTFEYKFSLKKGSKQLLFKLHLANYYDEDSEDDVSEVIPEYNGIKWIFTIVEKKKDSIIVKNCVENSRKLKKNVRNFEIPLNIYVVKDFKNNIFIQDEYFWRDFTEIFEPEQHITSFNSYWGFIFYQNLDKEDSFEYLTTKKIFSETVDLFVQMKSLLDEFI
ncbi:MAG: hypothetical protein KAH67_02380 [Flavobacteriaceae bacterium]|nr:hypothetical protein [Flavobacteriaceae bacterium]